VMGIEPTYSAWKAAALPLSYTRETQETGLLAMFTRVRNRTNAEQRDNGDISTRTPYVIYPPALHDADSRAILSGQWVRASGHKVSA